MTGSHLTHVVMTSSGTSSWGVGHLLAAEVKPTDLVLLFTDTCHEHWDNYRFLIQGSAEVFGVDLPAGLLERCEHIPRLRPAGSLGEAWELLDARRRFLQALARDAMAVMPGLRWEFEGRDLWRVFFDEGILGSDRFDACSKYLKRLFGRRILERGFDPASTVVYLGYDAGEQHRAQNAEPHWDPWAVRFPLVDRQLLKQDVHDWLDGLGIPAPELYSWGAAHSNCGSFCVRGGTAQFALLLRKDRDLYLFHERMEQWFRESTGKDVAIKSELPAGATRARKSRGVEVGPGQLDLDDWGSCSCFTPPDAAAVEKAKGAAGVPLTLREIRRRIEAQPELPGVGLPMARRAA